MERAMFGLGIWELVIIVIVVILFVRPEDMPKFFRKVGKLYGELKRYNDEIMHKFRTIDQQLKKPVSIITEEIKKPLDQSGAISESSSERKGEEQSGKGGAIDDRND